MRASKLAKSANGWVNPMKGKKANAEGIAKMKATIQAKKEAGIKPNRTPWSEETKRLAIERANATKAAKKDNGWVSPMKGRPKSKEQIAKMVATKKANAQKLDKNAK